jgi:hypothetical protein
LIDIGYIETVESKSGVGWVASPHLGPVPDEQIGRGEKSRVNVCWDGRREEEGESGGKERGGDGGPEMACHSPGE